MQVSVTSGARASALMAPGAAHALPGLILPGSLWVYTAFAGKKSGGTSGAFL